ncbi:hypothetical protein GCM10020360_26060 [Nonlabens tegetincola]
MRYERSQPGELVHVDIKKLGKIPDGGSWRAYGRGSDAHKRAQRASGKAARAGAFSAALGDDAKHRYTRPYRPQTNGKVERFNRTLAQEWAYAATYDSDEVGAATYDAWLHHHNHHRPHTGIGGQTPSDRVHNPTGNHN